MNKNSTTPILVISIIVMILSMATLLFFFKIIANKNEHTSAVLLTLANKIARKENIDALTNKISEVEQTQKTIDEHFVDSTQIDAFVDYLEKLGVSANTKVKVENFEVSTEDKNTLLVTLTSEGTFTNVMRTVELLENAPYQINITRTSLNKQPESSTIDEKTGKKISSGTALWQASISFSILTS